MINHNLLTVDKGIIIAADVSTLKDLNSLVEVASSVPEVVAIKVGFTLVLRYGLPSVINAINQISDLPVIYDHQKAGTDIPAMGLPFAEACRDAGVKGVIFFPLAGPRTLEGFVSGALKSGLTPIVGLVMTHKAFLQSEGGFILDIASQLICKQAIELGVHSFVLPGNRINIVSHFAEGPLLPVRPVEILMPGIGSQGGSITQAFEAAKPHHPFAIIGSAIYDAADPKLAINNFSMEMRKWIT